ncbi:uncharacterized protein MONBRDRAFT_26022 [Monosiga brevicollis MX1]|uniref:EGF-like domain-containing protein n=1 Tax=Monosiga brevicollis TaxID=81824 RepID=A9V152_MONBE|nr:uncharacterized protein MONBRDRAFT_26022 [Monosiga brevicollis MX1]EDQ88872.1 predicted protein [Monosiga brevicollis MX1]|eukprot:XP_001746485.1 hypothetical protein [Monosiga brevicollis MX1]
MGGASFQVGLLALLVSAAIARPANSGSIADVDCNGHGIFYQEEAALGVTACACFQCYTGPHCSTLRGNCSLETRVAEAALFQTWFDHVDADLSITVQRDYHLPYMKTPRSFPPNADPSDYDSLSLLLNSSIHRLHQRVGNVDTSGMTLLIGAGGVQLIDAALYALTQRKPQPEYMHVYAQPPFYPHFHQASNINPLTNFTQDLTSLDRSTLIEVLTTPNNPDNERKYPAAPDAAARITDLVYYWPQYLDINETFADDLMIFSLSKLAGYAASRIGWAFVRDSQVAATMSNYMWLQSTAPAVEAQLRAVKLLDAIVDQKDVNGLDFFTASRALLSERWRQLRSLFTASDSYRLAGQDGGLFMWIQCLDQQDQLDCAAPFASVGITTETGVPYGSDSSHRAQAIVPASTHRGDNYWQMTRRLNAYLPRYALDRHQLIDCDGLTVDTLHMVERALRPHQAQALQSLYEDRNDPRRWAITDDLELQQAREVEVAATSAASHDVVRDGLCHRVVMQYVHHVPTLRLAQLDALPLPRLPVRELAPSVLAAATPEAHEVLHNTTQCFKCHLVGNATDAAARETDFEAGIQAPASGSADPVVPDWPREFDVRFGLYANTSTQSLQNSTSHMYWNYDVPSMHIQHSECPPDFLPQIPGSITAACNLTFHLDGLWITWHNASQSTTDTPHCCQVIAADMTDNLGLNELGGFDYLGMMYTTDLWGRELAAQAWTNGAQFPISPGFHIMIDPSSNEDVHYYNGGAYQLEWALGPRNVAPQPRELFELPPTPECLQMCTHDMPRVPLPQPRF